MTRLAVAPLLCLLLALSASPSSRAQLAPPADARFEEFTISDIRVDGLQRISPGTVFSYLPVERGDRLDRSAAAESIRALFATGFFSDVTLTRQGDILVITVEERPAINKITLVGNKDVKTEELMKGLEGIGLSEGETFNRLQLDTVTRELQAQYNNRGKYNVKITPTINTLDRNRVDVTITIAEGKAAKIRHINIVGNETFSDEEILETWESDTTNWLSWYNRDDQYSREKLSGDLDRLVSWYLDRGYVDFNIESTQVSISPDNSDMYLVANVREGEVFKFGEVRISGDTIIPVEQVQRLLLAREGNTFSRRLLELTADQITSVLANIGYAFANVTPIPTVDRDNRTVAINMFVEPGQRVFVRRILFTGNSRTSDEVLRREMRQFEGAWYSQAALDRSKVRLQRLGFFENINIETPEVPGSADQVDVVVSVTERTSGSFIFGLGYSQLSGLITSVSVVQNNFFGSGNRIGVTVQNNRFVKRFDFSYFDPYFTDDGISVGYNLIYRELDQGQANIAAYTTDNGALQAVFGVPLTETDSIAVTFGIDSNQIRTVPGLTPDPIVDYVNAVNRRTFHAWRTEVAFARDSRNAYFNPTRGTFQRIAAEVALPGSTVEYYKLYYQFARYWPISRSLVLLTAAEIGYGDSYGDDFSRQVVATHPLTGLPVLDENGTPVLRTITADGLPFFENFYAGGVRSIRGFEDNTLGPNFVSPANPNFIQPLGGALKTTGSVELIFPTLFKNDATRLSAFLDFGNVFADADAFELREFRASVGLSLQWQAPIGPIVINLSQPLQTDRNDQTEKLQFSFGTTF